jgi:hypothetical protein
MTIVSISATRLTTERGDRCDNVGESAWFEAAITENGGGEGVGFIQLRNAKIGHNLCILFGLQWRWKLASITLACVPATGALVTYSKISPNYFHFPMRLE